MSDNTNDFSAAKVGDKLWVQVASYEGWGEVFTVLPNKGSIFVTTLIHGDFAFLKNGRMFEGGPQCLFWAKPRVIAPPRPKRLVKKTIEVRPCRSYFGQMVLAQDSFDSAEINWVGPIQTVVVEVEE